MNTIQGLNPGKIWLKSLDKLWFLLDEAVPRASSNSCSGISAAAPDLS